MEFSHWEWVEEPHWDFWGRYRPRYFQRAVFVHVIHVVMEIRNEASPLETETRRLRALKDQVDAEIELLDSHIELARKKVELKRLEAIVQKEAPKQIAYTPNVPFQPARSTGR
jgi:hypothetical protein